MTTSTLFTAELLEPKLRELMIYICERRITTRSFGHRHLNTQLCMSDFLHYRRYRESITGASYVCGEQGPWLAGFEAMLEQLVESGSVTVHLMNIGGYTQRRPLALEGANLFGFNGAEIATVEQILRATEGRSASDLADLAQSLTRWRDGELGDPLPYELALEEQSG